jgi:hypothetical protein
MVLNGLSQFWQRNLLYKLRKYPDLFSYILGSEAELYEPFEKGELDLETTYLGNFSQYLIAILQENLLTSALRSSCNLKD